MIDNPWKNMTSGLQRRVDSGNRHEFFWITDIEGRYGLYFKSKSDNIDINHRIELKGITLIQRVVKNKREFFLILNDNIQWEMFYILCKDLIETSKNHLEESKMVDAMEDRLNKWQQLLKKGMPRCLSIEMQLGLLGELICLRDILAPRIGLNQAIKAWCGAEHDKQDFIVESAIVEVKSYRINKGAIIYITSAEQLCSLHKPLYILANAFTQCESGTSIKDICDKISDCIQGNELMEGLFSSKLLEYGYIKELMDNDLERFKLDSQQLFKVDEEFPKITRDLLADGIINVKYSIDLLKCKQFVVDVNDIFLGGNND